MKPTWPSWLVLVLLLWVVGFLVSGTLPKSWARPYEEKQALTLRHGTEQYHLIYATRIAASGPKEFPKLFQDYVGEAYHHRLQPSPERLISITLGAFAVLLGGPEFLSLVYLALSAFLALLLVVFWGVSRSWGVRIAWWTTLLVSCSPLLLGFSRRASADLVAMLFLVISLFFLERSLFHPKGGSVRHWVGVSLVYTAAFLTQPVALLLAPVSVILLAGFSVYRWKSIPWTGFAAVSAVPLLLSVGLLWLTVGDLQVVWRALQISGLGGSQSLWMLGARAEPWFTSIISLMLISPWTLLLYLIWLGGLAGGRIQDEKIWFWSSLPVLFFVLMLFSGNIGLGSVMVLEVPLRLCVVFALHRWLWKKTGSISEAVKMGGVILLLLWLDLNVFHAFFVPEGFAVPSQSALFAFRQLVPVL